VIIDEKSVIIVVITVLTRNKIKEHKKKKKKGNRQNILPVITVKVSREQVERRLANCYNLSIKVKMPDILTKNFIVVKSVSICHVVM